MNQATKDYIKQWILKAEEDLLVVERLIEGQIVAPASICFHCQQAAEKYLKAYLIFHKVEIRRTHNIEFLLSECNDIDLVFGEIDAKNLSDYGVDVRYPGDMYIPDESEVRDCIAIVKRIKRAVEESIFSEIF
ncbi:MAG: HEPN domain-containing protein [Kiritimatiellae bacterium]|jgi:HEPN domain-containing protein|nr:HEPN domain-containing protein [Kiritimatiellia bacterium]